MESKQSQEYKQKKLSPILVPMVADILHDKPHNVPKYIVQYLEKNYLGGGAFSQRSQLEALRDEASHLKQYETQDNDSGSQGGSEQESDDEVDELPQLKPAAQKKGPRCSVSAEAYGLWNKKADFKPRNIPKSEATKAKISQRLNQSFMFQNLDNQEKTIVINAMEEKKFAQGVAVIKQGDDGDDLYVVEQGTLSCQKLFAGKSEPTHLKNYEPGQAFGELALLYNAPRAATITTKTPSLLWSLDRATFNHIVKDSASKKREKYDDFLKSVKILQSMDAYERQKLPDALKSFEFSNGEYIIKEGDDGNIFYMIVSGEAVATKTIDAGQPPKEVMKYKVGDYFGELALLKNEPRAANVIAKNECKVVGLDRHSFKRLLGPLEDILKRNMDVYKEYC